MSAIRLRPLPRKNYELPLEGPLPSWTFVKPVSVDHSDLQAENDALKAEIASLKAENASLTFQLNRAVGSNEHLRAIIWSQGVRPEVKFSARPAAPKEPVGTQSGVFNRPRGLRIDRGGNNLP
jgi:hypothetical protein